MRICVFGAGSVGGYLAACLLKGGHHEVSIVARGAQLHAIRDNGLRLVTPVDDFVVRPSQVSDRAHDLRSQDLVFVTLKAHSQSAAAGDIASLLGSAGTAVFVNNGVPWWWTYRGVDTGRPLPLLDNGAALWNEVRPERTIGCVVYSANEVIRPGVVRHTANNHWVLGEPDGQSTPRLASIVDAMRGAGLAAEATADIRHRVWTKLLRNVPINSLSALTRLPVDRLAQVPGMAQLFSQLIDEVAAVAAAHGSDLDSQVPAARQALALAGATDGHRPLSIRPSMLQDVLAGRQMEVEAILGQLSVFARESGIPTPALTTLVPLIRGLDKADSSAA